jgi:GTP pyrophosphokinase
MQNKHVTFEEIYDILAVRIIFTPRSREEEVNECFNIYVAISKIYKSHPDRLRDWLNHPKTNGYQALHVTLMSKQGRWIEVQIRSDRMDEVAEQGLAAHWKYKEGEEEEEYTEDEAELNEWLRTIKEILDDPQPDAMDFLDAIKLNLFASEIFVFTPKGEIKTMPAGCTALDFAFSIHTFLGSHCIGAKVNHKLVPLSHKLQSGDQVEILSSKSQHVQPAWINFVSTAKAKGKIQAILRRDNREVQKRGEELLTEWLKKHDKEYSIAVADELAEYHDIRRHDDFFQALGEKTVILGEKDLDELDGKNKKKQASSGGWRRYMPFVKAKKQEEETPVELFVVPEKFNRKKPIFITEDNIRQYKFPSCCHPIPGDDALGYIDNKNQIEIHKRTCPVAAKLKSAFGNRILDVKWDMHKRLYFIATIRIGGIDRVGILNEITQVISSQMNVNIRNLNITCEDGMFDGTLELRVHDRDDVRLIMNNLKKVEDLKEISEIM